MATKGVIHVLPATDASSRSAPPLISDAPSSQKGRGGYYTPRNIADFLVDWAVRSSNDRVLDPAVGEGVFLEAAVERLSLLGRKQPTSRLLGFEVDDQAFAHAVGRLPGIELLRRDFFDTEPEAKFDAVVGNPPYIRYHYFSGESRSKGLSRARTQGVALTQLASSWAPFLVHACGFLNPFGRLALVLPAELLSTDYAQPVRDFLLSRFSSVNIITFDRRVFPGALVDVVLLLAEGNGPGNLFVHRVSSDQDLLNLSLHRTKSEPAAKWTSSLLDSSAQEAIAVAYETMVPLSEIASVDIGLVTGANSFFLLSDNDVLQHQLRPNDVTPIVAKAHQLPGHSLTPEVWEAQRFAGEPVWLFTPMDETEATRRYIDEGESSGLDGRYKCRIRSPWWRIKLLPPPDLILPYMSHRAPRLVANEAGVQTTNLLHNVRLRTPLDRLERSALALAWTNSATLLSAELCGRSYGGGVLKLETREAEKVLVPRLTPAVVRELTKQAATIDSLMLRNLVESVADVVDGIVLKCLPTPIRSQLRSGWMDLRSRRNSRSGGTKLVV